MGLLFSVFWLKAIRWRLLLQPLRKFQTKEVVPPLMIGFMGNNLLPAHLGELIRIFVLGREFSLSKAAVFSSVVLERIFDTAVVLLFLAMSLLLVDELPSWVSTTIFFVTIFAALAILFLAAYLFWTQRLIRATRRAFSFLPERFAQKLTETMEWPRWLICLPLNLPTRRCLSPPPSDPRVQLPPCRFATAAIHGG